MAASTRTTKYNIAAFMHDSFLDDAFSNLTIIGFHFVLYLVYKLCILNGMQVFLKDSTYVGHIVYLNY